MSNPARRSGVGPCPPAHTTLLLITLAAVWAVGAGSIEAQTLRGVLSERESYEPIDLGAVLLVSADADTLDQTITDASGFFSLTAPGAGE